MMNNNYCVYMHIFPNGKRYIGITSQVPKKRWGNGRGYKECPKMKEAIKKYGWENVQHYIVSEGLTKREAENLEIELIKQFNSTVNGYNIEYGGNVIGTHNEETKIKISKGNKGKQVSPETRNLLSEARKGKFTGTDNPFYGKHHSDETKQKHSDFMKGNTYFKGHHHSDDFKKYKSKQMSAKYANGGNPRCKKVCMTTKEGAETVFWSLRKAAETADVSVATMYRYVHEGITKNGNTWRYIDEA